MPKRWTWEEDSKLLLAILRFHKIDYAGVAQTMGDGVNAGAITRRVAKIKALAKAAGDIDPTAGSGRPVAAQVVNRTNAPRSRNAAGGAAMTTTKKRKRGGRKKEESSEDEDDDEEDERWEGGKDEDDDEDGDENENEGGSVKVVDEEEDDDEESEEEEERGAKRRRVGVKKEESSESQEDKEPDDDQEEEGEGQEVEWQQWEAEEVSDEGAKMVAEDEWPESEIDADDSDGLYA